MFKNQNNGATFKSSEFTHSRLILSVSTITTSVGVVTVRRGGWQTRLAWQLRAANIGLKRTAVCLVFVKNAWLAGKVFRLFSTRRSTAPGESMSLQQQSSVRSRSQDQLGLTQYRLNVRDLRQSPLR